MPPDYDFNAPIFAYRDDDTHQYVPIQAATGTLTVNDGAWFTENAVVSRTDDLQRQIDELRAHFMNVDAGWVTQDDVINRDAFDAHLYSVNALNTEDLRNGFTERYLGWADNPIIHADLAERIEIRGPISGESNASDDCFREPEIEPASEDELSSFLEDCGVLTEAV